ncbi:pancreatic lipase-related protein 2-like [Stegodyphus dumicola]|uniref:pancreatic lipase-related protein 2-like n=1 Tax=Stegodyphus dumicola TaxID=202533 RepID=UPI0015AABC28|nr:pancreatic lipase-related protein 2-like [Stegodyphus dumicola]
MIAFRFVILLAAVVAATAILDKLPKIPKPKIPKIPELPKPKIPKVKEIKEKLLGEVCYGDLGCFSIRPPWNLPILERGLVGLPDSPENVGTEFRFYSPKNVDEPQYISTANFSSWDVKKSGFSRLAKSIFIIHGYRDGNSPWPVRLKNALIKREKANVFVVNWSKGAGAPPYILLEYQKVSDNTRVAGAEVGYFIQKLIAATKLNPKRVHVIGHSLGAHVAGYAGKWFKNNSTKKVGRITGLDPAGPRFNRVDPIVRIDREDATFVDIIHTNYAPNRFEGLGIKETIGHFDFYPSGGEDQPGCIKAREARKKIIGELTDPSQLFDVIWNIKSGKSENISEGFNEFGCSHVRAYKLFTASLEEPKCKFQALLCDSWKDFQTGACGACKGSKCVNMGYYAANKKILAKKGKSLVFYLDTKGKDPYCMEKP